MTTIETPLKFHYNNDTPAYVIVCKDVTEAYQYSQTLDRQLAESIVKGAVELDKQHHDAHVYMVYETTVGDATAHCNDVQYYADTCGFVMSASSYKYTKGEKRA